MSLGSRGAAWTVAALLLIAVALASFYAVQARRGAPRETASVVGGNPEDGRETIVRYACGTCHSIEGIRQARGRVGPPLTGVAQRRYLGGQLVNTPENMVRWIRNPQTYAPGTAMPTLGVTEQEARDITAYLYRLR